MALKALFIQIRNRPNIHNPTVTNRQKMLGAYEASGANKTYLHFFHGLALFTWIFSMPVTLVQSPRRFHGRLAEQNTPIRRRGQNLP
jgi:hypothetical protein